ncbi:MAG TPA: hypothetical protein VN903_34150 [Polyangia bacterium]|jgi:hypothetical protein|nr:hypothetical protein [Polyangia bacterium]
MDDLRPRGPGRFVLKGLAVASALGFLTLVMVQAARFYAPPPAAPKKVPRLLGPATKAAPVVRPPPLEPPEEPRRALLPATKAGILGPLKLTPPDPIRPLPLPDREGRIPRN